MAAPDMGIKIEAKVYERERGHSSLGGIGKRNCLIGYTAKYIARLWMKSRKSSEISRQRTNLELGGIGLKVL